MKKVLLTSLFALVCVGINAQQAKPSVKQTHQIEAAHKDKVRFEETQARMIDVTANAYVKPMTVELKMKEEKGAPIKGVFKIRFTATDIAALGADIPNIKSKALYLACGQVDADAIVGATFNITAEGTDIRNGCLVEVTGFPADFINWHTATTADLEWIKLDITRRANDLENFKAVIRNNTVLPAVK